MKTSFRNLFNKQYFNIVNIICNAYLIFEIDNISHIKYINYCID